MSFLHHLINRIFFKKIKNKNFTILSNNCLAAFIYHKYHLQFLTPTININIPAADFIKFCKNLDYYLTCDVTPAKTYDQNWFTSIGGGKIDFPVGQLGDIKLYFQHDTSFEKARNDWNRRKKRINKNNLFIILLDVNPSEKSLQAFNNLPYKNKLYLYFKGKFPGSTSFYIDGLENTSHAWFDFMKKSKKRYYEQFDFVSWLNTGLKKQ